MQLKRVVKNTLSGSLVVLIQNYFLFPLRVRKWKLLGNTFPPPPVVKRMTVKKYQKKYKYNVFVETGTFLGGMIEFQKNNYKKIYSIELDDALHKRAKEMFKDCSHIELICGDSAKALKDIVENNLQEPTIFWLDAHYSGGVTAMADKQTPILQELETIFKKNLKHVILIDDARCFTGENDYPTIDEIKNLIKSKDSSYLVDVKDDIIRVIPF